MGFLRKIGFCIVAATGFVSLQSSKAESISSDIYSPAACKRYADYFTKGIGGTELLPFSFALKREKLDYSYESLKTVDRYLDAVHEKKQSLDHHSEGIIVFWTGCYVGETMIKNNKTPIHWEKYGTYIRKVPKFAEIADFGMGTALLLVDNKNGSSLPLNKVGQYIENGAEDSVFFFSTIMNK